MKNLNNALNAPNSPIFNTILERSRTQILSIGYNVILLKSKVKKRLKILLKIFFFNF